MIYSQTNDTSDFENYKKTLSIKILINDIETIKKEMEREDLTDNLMLSYKKHLKDLKNKLKRLTKQS